MIDSKDRRDLHALQGDIYAFTHDATLIDWLVFVVLQDGWDEDYDGVSQTQE